MTRIWIEGYEVTGDLGRLFGHFLDVDDSIKTAYLISPSEGDECITPTKKILFEFLEHRNDFPLYLYFSDEYVLRERHQQYLPVTSFDRNPPSVLIKPGHDGCGFFPYTQTMYR